MAEANDKEVEVKEEANEPAPLEPGKVGEKPVRPTGIVLIAVYLVLFCILLVWGLVQLWPRAAGATEAAGPCSSATFLFWTFRLSDEVRLLLIVALAGALGSLVHALRSLYWYVGNRALVRSWLMKYFLLPFAGAALAVIFYFVIRGGFFSREATMQQTDPFGFAALAGLVGMFSEQAVLKLKEVADTVFKKPPEGADSKPQ
ncbi:hypothetical protein HQ563_03795 [bacterium]|nr:hypothetical protein [bacterium]